MEGCVIAVDKYGPLDRLKNRTYWEYAVTAVGYINRQTIDTLMNGIWSRKILIILLLSSHATKAAKSKLVQCAGGFIRCAIFFFV